LGHVDHGKTTLLDYIRKTNVAAKEAGGITQAIGASVVTTKEGKKITFIDTPGHAAFSNMRARGAKIADIAILVVAAGDGVKPQTKEALEYILANKLPFIVAATKIDLPSASVETVRNQLEKEGVSFEGRGGDTPLVPVSGKSGEGVVDLLEMITLISELNNISGDPEGALNAIVVETAKDKRGPTATLVVRNGTLKVGDEIVSETERAKVRGLFDWLGKPIKDVGPGEPTLLLGFKDTPPVGTRIWSVDQKQIAPAVLSEKETVGVSAKKFSPAGNQGEIAIVLKAQNTGSLEAVISNLPAEVTVVASGVGDVTESEVFLAKAVNADIFAFEAKTPSMVRKLADTEGVSIESFTIIYELFERLDEIIKKGKVEVLGRAEILAEFPFDGKRIAGCKVLQGKIGKKDPLVLTRNDAELGKTTAVSLKKAKVDVDEAKQGEECGILFSPQLDFKIGDVILAVQK
jgi:translation initiation factor IF-2